MIMKKLFTLVAFVVTLTTIAQSVAINTDGSAADASAILDLQSTTSGFLPPRMTAAQRDDIVNPVAGLQIWCSDCLPSGGIVVYSGSEWTNQAAVNSNLQAQITALLTKSLPSVTIGGQIWQNRNLDVTTYRDGTEIPEVADASEWGQLTTGAYCDGDSDNDDDNDDNGAIYGKQYNWYAVMGITTTESATPTTEEILARKKLAPTGWHVPTYGDWTTVTTFIFREASMGNVGDKMKQVGTTHWVGNNNRATNSSGFTALPGGYRYDSGTYVARGAAGRWWSSTQDSGTSAGFLSVNSYDMDRGSNDKTFGLSVRCLRD
jgi:uncharacterized protein (TIGR02145 family)